MTAEDIADDLGEPTLCGAAGQGTCLPILDQERYVEIGGPCEPGLNEFPLVVCVAPWSAGQAIPTAENIARLSLALVRAYSSFKAEDPRNVIDLVLAIEAWDAQKVEQILRDSKEFDEAFELMNGLGMDTATVGLGGGGFVIAGIGVEAGAAIDTKIKYFRSSARRGSRRMAYRPVSAPTCFLEAGCRPTATLAERPPGAVCR